MTANEELVMQRTTTTSIGLFAAWAYHDLEELFTMRETSRVVAARVPSWVPIPDDVRQDGLSQQHVNLGISLMGAYIAAVSAVGVGSRGRSRLFRGVLLAFGLHGFGHIGEGLSDRDGTAPWAAATILLIPTVHVVTRLLLGRKRRAAMGGRTR
jgi:hypothetical protein